MYGGFSFEQDAMRARDELQDALSAFQQPQQQQMGMPQQQMGMQQPQQQPMMPPQQPQMPYGAPQQPQMGQMQPQMGQMPQQQPQQQMGPQNAFAVNPQGYAKGGLAVWDKDRPDDLGKPKTLSVKKKSAAKRRAKSAGRPYPNLVDNIAAARKKGK
jgi:hypothetical protein